MRPFTSLLALIALAVFAVPTPVAAQGSDDETVVAFVNVSVIPMDTERLIADATVVVEGDRITAVGPASEIDVPDGAQVIDGNGGYLLPGLVDMHYHADGEPNSLALALANGITTVQNLNADALASDSELAAAVATGDLAGPRIINGFHAVGFPVEIQFAFEQINNALQPWFSLHDFANSLEAAPPLGFTPDAESGDRYAASAIGAGTGFFKTNTDVPRDAFDVIVEAAAEHDLTVQGHVSGQIGLEHYLESGAHPHHLTEIAPYLSSDAIQGVPLQPYDFALIDERLPDLARLMVDNGTWFTPTVNLMWYLDQNLNNLDGLRQRPAVRYLPPGEQRPLADPEANFVVQAFGSRPDADEIGARYLAMQERIIRELHEAGVPILAGTDASAAPASIRGFDLHLEIKLLVDYGLTPFQALQAATSAPAQFLAEADDWGTVTAGTRADLVLLGSNPLDDITATRDIDGVMTVGTWHTAAELQTMLDAIAAEYEALANITMAPFSSEELGINGVAPAEWTELDPGVWTRSDPDADPTFLVQQAAPTADADGLIAGVLDNFGATELGDPIDAVEVDDVTWEIYHPEAELGLLVARAEVGQSVLLVALVALPAELNELTESVLRPAVSALQGASS